MTKKNYELEKFCRKLLKENKDKEYTELFIDDPVAVKNKDYSRYYPKQTRVSSKTVIDNNH